MKKKILLILVVFLFPMFVLAEETVSGEYGTYEDASKMLKETMKAYYLRGPYLQYNYARATYGREAPEESTSQDPKYMVCAAYTYDVYADAFGMLYQKDVSEFPRYNYDIMDQAWLKYKSGDELDGSFLIFYESISAGTTTSSSGLVRERKKEKYLYGDNDPDSDVGNFATLVEQVRPGDLFVYTGHALIAYDVGINPDTGEKDILILNSTQTPFIKSRIESTSKMSFNFFANSNGINNILDIPREGTIKMAWLSELSSFMWDGEFSCKTTECAVIRPVYEKDGKAMFNYHITPSQYEKGMLRTKYPGVTIEKTVNVGDKDSIYIGDELEYTVKVTNNSGVSYDDASYNAFGIEETLGESVEYISSSNDGVYNDGFIKWEVNSLAAGASIEFKYKVKVKNNVSEVGKEVIADGKFYSLDNKDVYIATGNVTNKIIPKVTKLKATYSSCYNEKKNDYSDIELINEIYKCVNNKDYNFDDFYFDSLFEKTAGSKSTSTINFKEDLDSTYENFKNMVLNNYFNGLAISGSSYYLPRWSSVSSNFRAKTIIPSDFKEGDVLIYRIYSSEYTNEDGFYAYIYIDGKFVGVNGSGTKKRNEFTYNYYTDNDLSLNSYLYEASLKLDSSIKDNVLTFVNYQTLLEKDYYVIFRPELVMKEADNVVFVEPTKHNYIQNYEKLDLTGGSLTITNNDGSIDVVNLDDDSVSVTGFDNSKIGKNTLTVSYEDYSDTFDVEIISKQSVEVTIKSLPVKTNYIQNYEKLDLTGGELKVTYNDETTDTVSMTNENIVVTGFDNSKLGKNNIIIEYDGHSVNFDVEIVSKQMSGISIESMPIKANYIQQTEELDLTGGELKVTYNDETTDTISMTNEDVKVTGFDNSKLGKNTLTVSYNGFTSTFDVEIISKKVKSIEITKLPLKTSYIQNYEKLDLTEGIITVTFTDDTTDTISMTYDKVKVTGFDNSKVGKNTLTVEYEGANDTFEVEIVSKQISGISIESVPSKTNYIQNYEKLDLTGGNIKITYNDESTDTISMTNEDVKVTGFDNSKLGKNVIKVEYKEFDDTFEVEIVSKQISSISIDDVPIKVNYIQNYEKLDLTGGNIKVIYNDESTDTISMTNENVKVTGFDNSKVGKNTLTVSYNGFTSTFDVGIVSKSITGINISVSPSKKNYIQNYEKLDLTGGIITVIYNDKTSDKVSMTNENVITSGFDNSKVGKNTVVVSYNGFKDTMEVEILTKQSVKIEVTKAPLKTDYIQNYEKLDLGGGIITVTYNDNSTDTVSLTNENVKIIGFDNSRLGKNTITIEYEGHSVSFDVEIVEDNNDEVSNPQTGFNRIMYVLVVIALCSVYYFIKRSNKITIN